MTFKEPVYKILEHVKNEPYFCWPGKMGGELTTRNQSLYCTYHREKDHTTKQCPVLKDHFEQLVKLEHLKEYVVGQGGENIGQGSGSQGNTLPPLLGIIEVIHATSIGVNVSCRRGILSVVTPPNIKAVCQLEKKPRKNSGSITFGEAGLEGTSQPYDDASVVTSQIGGFLVKRVMIDQGNGAEIM